MQKRTFETRCGTISYWVSDVFQADAPSIVFLPGLTADHRLFDQQIACFEAKANVLVWDAPAHAASRPFRMDFTLSDKADWICEILQREGFTAPILVGQSMGAYVGQMILERHPGALKGFISIDSAPLQRRYVTAAEIVMLRHTERIYRLYPWKPLIKAGAEGTAETPYGQDLMRRMMEQYDHAEYARLAAHGYRMLADAMAADLAYTIDCPALLICGEQDKAGSTRRYNRAWHKQTGIPIAWIAGAGHNSNTDQPEQINALINRFIEALA